MEEPNSTTENPTENPTETTPVESSPEAQESQDESSPDSIENLMGEDNGIDVNIPSQEELQTLLEKIREMSPNERNMLLANLAKLNGVNPEEKRFTSASKRDMLKEKMRRKRMEFQNRRIPQKVLKMKREKAIEKHQKKIEELEKTRQIIDEKNQNESDNEPVENQNN